MHRRAVAAVILLAVVVVATVAILVAQQKPAPAPLPSPSTAVPQTLLVQLRGSNLLAMGSVLTGVDEDKELSQLSWRADWWVDQEGRFEVSAAELGRKPVPYVMQTVQNQTQVGVDDAWVLDRLAFAGLVDAVGGVRVYFPKTTAYLDESGVPVLLTRGMHDLSGAQAADLILDSSLRDEQARLTRFEDVWDQILRRFPTDSEKARTLVVSLGALSKSTMNTEDLAGYLVQAHELKVLGQSVEGRVPLTTDNRVRVRPPQVVRMAYALDQDRIAGRIDTLFPEFSAPEFPVARIQAMVPRSESVVEIRSALDARGWVSAWGGRAVASGTSVEIVPGLSEPQSMGMEEALGVTPTVAELPWGQAQVLIGPEPAVGS